MPRRGVLALSRLVVLVGATTLAVIVAGGTAITVGVATALRSAPGTRSDGRHSVG